MTNDADQNETRKEVNIMTKCCECGRLTTDDWLFETDQPEIWVCGDCADVPDALLPIEDYVEYLRELREGRT